MVGLEPPRHGELAEVVGGDLIERRVARVACVAAVGRPFAFFGARLPAHTDNGDGKHENERNQRRQVT